MGLFDIKKYDKGDKKYNVALGIPQYLPTGVKIDIEACADTKKYKELLKVVDNSNLPENEKAIFRLAAARFIDFNYENFAEYYCNTTSKETQEVMEKLCLVLVDIKDAIKNGFVKQNKFIEEVTKDAIAAGYWDKEKKNGK